MKKWFGLLLLSGAALAADGPRIVYTKSFPNSVPAWVQITVDRAGNAEYRDSPDDQPPLKFKLDDAAAGTIFDLADKLDHFKRPLETQLKVAFMGEKTFRYENGAE